MATKWVDNNEYFGPDRRKRGTSKLFGERRKYDEAGELPPLGALLRRLRVQILALSTGDDATRTLPLLASAIAEANRLGYRRCAATLMDVDRAIRQQGARAAQSADAKIVEAMDHAGARR